MIRLYIEDKLVELTDDIIINQTYETLDPDKLSSIKNSFSKTVDIPGTRENNILFGDIFRIDRYIPSGLKGDIHGRIYNRDYQYDPHKKASYMLFKNGAVVNRGYCTLDNIVVKPDNSVTYKITLYGGIGEFFYSLSYNDDGSPKTLFDMHWAWRPKGKNNYGEPMSPEEEDGNVIMECTTKNVNQAYHLLKPIEVITSDQEIGEHWGEPGWWYDDNTAYNITDVDKDVVFVPCYTGTYDDFDSKHMLISTFNQNYYTGIGDTNYLTAETRAKLKNSFPDSFTDYSDDPDNPTTYHTLSKSLDPTGAYRYGLATFSRDLDPWEAGDIRVNEMPVAIRMSKLMRTISEPWNNGGYEVKWNQDILDSPYWNYSWIMLGKMDQEKDEGIESIATLSLDTSTYIMDVSYNRHNGTATFPDSSAVIEREYTVTGWTTNEGPFMFAQDFNLNVSAWGGYTETYASTNGQLVSGTYSYSNRFENVHIAGRIYKYLMVESHKKVVSSYLAFITSIYDGTTLKKEVLDLYFFQSDGVDNKYNLCYVNTDFLQHIINKVNQHFSTEFTLDNTYMHIVNIRFVSRISHYPDYLYVSDDSPTENISVRITSGISNLRITQKQFLAFLTYQYDTGFDYTTHTQTVTANITNSGIYGFESTSMRGNIINDKFGMFPAPSSYPNHILFQNNIKSYYLRVADNTSGFKTMSLTKKMLFAKSQSPFKYLADLSKMMNWRITADNTQKKIYIDPLDLFYKRLPYDITEKVDYSRDLNIKNITTQSKRINVGLETLDTYPVSLFNRIDRDKFNTYHYDTGIEFNTTETNLLDDLVYKNALDWQQSSVFYNLFPQFPKAYNTPTVAWTLFDVSTNNIDIIKKEKVVLGVPSIDTNLTGSNDWMPKVALFDKDNKYVEADTVPIFLNGFVANYDYVNVDTSVYTICPRISLSEDTYEQYFFNGGRCYVYDFKYNDAMASWGMYSSDQKGTAFSCALPFFTRELYNLYESDVLTETVTLQQTGVWPNQYFSFENNVYTVTGDNNWEMRSYAIDLNTMSNLKFTAHYPADQTGQVIMKWTNYGGAIGAEGTIGPAQHDFVDAAINVSNDLAFIYMNVWKGNAETTYITADVRTVLPPEWKPKYEVMASWNLVPQDNTLKMYDLEKVRFLRNPEITFSKQTTNIGLINDNEYTQSIPTYVSNAIYEKSWRGYMNDLYDRNTRDITLYIDLSDFSSPNEIMRTVFTWRGFYWIPMKLENFRTSDIGQDKFTKCTLHKVADINNWVRNFNE